MEREQFNLRSLKLSGDGGVEATYVTKTENPKRTDTREVNIKDSVVPAPELKEVFENEGVDFLSRALGFKELCTAKKYDEAVDRVSCHKFTIKDKGEDKLIVVTGKLSTGGSKVAVNSPAKMAEKNGYGIDMSEAINKLEDEAFAYFFEGKKAQTDIQDMLEGSDESSEEESE